jgi:DNA-binding transcriptional regulator YiaG
MPRREKKTSGKLHLREELEDSVRSFAKLLDISKSHVQRYEIGETTLPAKSSKVLTELRESIGR